MAHGIAIVVGDDPLSIMGKHVIDYAQPESTYTRKNCDRAGVHKFLPSTKDGKLKSKIKAVDLDLAKLDWCPIAGVVTPVGWFTISDHGGVDEAYSPTNELTKKKVVKMIKDLKEIYPDTLLTSFDCHF